MHIHKLRRSTAALTHHVSKGHNRHGWPAKHLPQWKHINARIVRDHEEIGVVPHCHACDAIVRTRKPLHLTFQWRLACCHQQQ